ncbi:hypothetical protein NM688_g750 [Phlebia brevispora]|uniref:Uncharacterized protein n=1 Tax=Phlebia brevispora TaxID=194682 RepID=A0ACC1TDK8_9APHY|nr:hypothetical protein NM688_g750 [Phlebia brevispora]
MYIEHRSIAGVSFGPEPLVMDNLVADMRYPPAKDTRDHIDTLKLLLALPFSSTLADLIDWNAFEAYEIAPALPNCTVKPIGPGFKMLRPITSWQESDYEEVKWIRVPAPSIPDDTVMQLYFGPPPVTAADIPHELHDLINPGHQCLTRDECERNYVECSREQLGSMALVCRRWARIIQPLIFWHVELSNKQLFGARQFKEPGTRIGEHIRHFKGCLDGGEHFRKPSLHYLGLYVWPKLRRLEHNEVRLRLKGPVPKKLGVLSSIHAFPRFHPNFSAGIRFVELRDVHFKSFGHLVRLIKELPTLRSLECTRVTWESCALRAGGVVYPTSFLARENPLWFVQYDFTDCTDAAGAGWLGVLLGKTRQDVLDLDDASSLCAVASAWKTNCSYRYQDEIGWLRRMHAFLTPRVGHGGRRNILAITFDLIDATLPTNVDWPQIDEQLALLGTLQVVLILLPHSRTDHYLAKVHPLIPLLGQSHKLRFALRNGDHDMSLYSKASLVDGQFNETGDTVKGATWGWLKLL